MSLELDASGLAMGVAGMGKIESILETWRIDDEWWRQPIARAYLQVVLEGGKRLVLFQDLLTGEWFVQTP